MFEGYCLLLLLTVLWITDRCRAWSWSQMYNCINIVRTLSRGCRIELAKIITFCFAYPGTIATEMLCLKLPLIFFLLSRCSIWCSLSNCLNIQPHGCQLSVCKQVKCAQDLMTMLSCISCPLCSLACPETACPWHSTTFCQVRPCTVSHRWKHAALPYAGSAGEIINAIMPC